MMKVEERLWEVEKVDNYKWTEKKINGKKEIEQTYEVFWVGYTLVRAILTFHETFCYRRTTREKASDITPDNMRTYWRLVKKSLDEYEEMRKRGEKFAETMQACKYRKAAEAAEKLRKKKLPGVVVPDLDGYVGECMEVIIISVSDTMVVFLWASSCSSFVFVFLKCTGDVSLPEMNCKLIRVDSGREHVK